MRPTLRYALGASVVMAALAQWWPQPTALLVPAAVRHAADGADQLGSPNQEGSLASPSLPAKLEPVALEPAQRDPFVPWLASPPHTPVAKVAAASPPMVLPVQMPMPAQLPSAPPQSLRYLGTMQTPTGATLVMLANGDSALPVEPGTRLPNGYVVQSLGPNAVRLLYPPTATVVELPIAASTPH